MATKDITDLDVCRAVGHASAIGKLPLEQLWRETGEHPKVALRAMERACRRGLIVGDGHAVRLTGQGLAFLGEHRA